MGPALIEPDHPDQPYAHTLDNGAAMGPALIEPDHHSIAPASTSAAPCRNGAGSHRAGSPVRLKADLPDGNRPQWGRLSSSRITGQLGALVARAKPGRNGAGSHRAGSPNTARPAMIEGT